MDSMFCSSRVSTLKFFKIYYSWKNIEKFFKLFFSEKFEKKNVNYFLLKNFEKKIYFLGENKKNCWNLKKKQKINLKTRLINST